MFFVSAVEIFIGKYEQVKKFSVFTPHNCTQPNLASGPKNVSNTQAVWTFMQLFKFWVVLMFIWT